MAQTYTTQFFRVSNGEITTHDPQSLVSTAKDIRILSADVQWEGITTSETTSDTDYFTDTNTREFQGFKKGDTITIGAPPPTGDNTYRYDTILEAKSDLAADPTIFVETTNNGEQQDGSIVADGTYQQVYDNAFSGTDSSGDSTTITADSVFATTNSGEQEGAVDIRVTFRRYSKTTTTVTTTDRTEDPRVTRDVLGESDGITLNGDELSSFVALSDLDPDTEEFYHDIDGSGEARFRFRFDYEETFPTPLSQARVYDADQDVIHKVALADPSDSRLNYTAVRVAVEGTTYVFDVVDPSDPDAISWLRIQHPTHGVLSPRAYETVSV